MHAVLVQVQQQLSSPGLSEPAFFQRAAQAALDATQGEGTSVELLDAEGLRCVAATGSPARVAGQWLALADCRSWPAIAAGQTIRCNAPGQDGWALASAQQDLQLCSSLEVPLRRDTTVVGTLKVWSSVAGAFTERDLAHLEILSESVGALLKLRQVAAQLRVSQQQYESLFLAHPQPMWVCTLSDRLPLLAVNEAMAQAYGYQRDELLSMGLADLWPPNNFESQIQALLALNTTPDPVVLRMKHRRKDGRQMDVEVTSRPVAFDGVPALQCMGTDITRRLATEREIARMGRARHLLSACNEAIVRADSEAQLLAAVCRITVALGGYRMTWVGLARDDAQKSIECVASAGAEPDYLEDLQLSWGADSPHGHGPGGETIRSGRAVIVTDVRTTTGYTGLADRLHPRGFHGLVCLPLKDSDRTFGVLYLYASEILQMSLHESELLDELAKDLAFGILSLRARQAQQRMQTSVLKVAASVSAATGTAFFVRLVHNMAEALGAETACLGRFIPGAAGKPERLATLALVVNGKLVPNTEYSLSGTPSALLANQQQLYVSDSLLARFPDAAVLARTRAQAYVGQQLCDSTGAVTGMLFVLFRQPLEDAAFAQSTLQIFASRASAEIERLAADAHIRHQASLLDQARDAIIVRDLGHKITYWNQGAERLYGWSRDQAIGQSVDALLHLDQGTFKRAALAVLTHGEWTGEMVQRHRDGHTIDIEGRWTLISGEEGAPSSILSINTDIRERKATEREIQRLAFYDALTGLPNRMLLMDRARQALANASRSGDGGAMLFIDLDNFKTLNDTLGHDKGDLLLQHVATRLKTCVRDNDTVARLGGDEFVVMLEALNSEPGALALNARVAAEKILFTLAQPFQLDGLHYRTTPSIGIALFGEGATTVGDLLKQADLAMYQAKSGGRNTLRFYNPLMQAVVSARAELESDMRAALAEGQFLLHYQPQVRHDGSWLGVEALTRWNHPQRGLVSPAEFIPVAEETGLILTLGRWVMHTACKVLAGWQSDPSLHHLSMAVNVSSRQFRNVNFVQDVTRMLAITGAPAHRLKLELTESVLVDDVEATIATMEALRAVGVGFSLDDFGTGYSSLSYLKRMPLQQVKIDQSFVRDLLSDPNDAAIVDTIVALSAALRLDVIAEGVETPEQGEILLKAGCMAFQGYLYAKPMPLEALTALLSKHLGNVGL